MSTPPPPEAEPTEASPLPWREGIKGRGERSFDSKFNPLSPHPNLPPPGGKEFGKPFGRF